MKWVVVFLDVQQQRVLSWGKKPKAMKRSVSPPCWNSKPCFPVNILITILTAWLPNALVTALKVWHKITMTEFFKFYRLSGMCISKSELTLNLIQTLI